MTKIKLNEQQQQAVEHKDGALGVIASAGSGKSEVLLRRIENLVKNHKVFEKEILAITFTRNTADELTERLAHMGLNHVNVGTFHSICMNQLNAEGYGISGYNMIKEWQIENLFKKINKRADTKEIMSFIGFQKNHMITPEDEFMHKHSDYSEKDLRKYYKTYEEYKENNKLYDFDDFLLLGLQMLKDNPNKYVFDYILVDEHQDSNLVQNELLKEWSKSGNVFTCFDFRQAIYGFRGSDTEYSMNFTKHWENAEMLNMHINYRSPKNIVEKSNYFIKQYYGDYKHYKDAESFNQSDGNIDIISSPNRGVEGMKIANEIEKLINKGVEPNDIAVLYRNNSHADYVESQLKFKGIEYDIANDGSFFKRREIAGILSALRLIIDNRDDSAFESVFRTRVYPLMYFSNQVYNDIQTTAQENGSSLLEALVDNSYDKGWQKSSAVKFVHIIDELQDMYDEGSDVVELIDRIIFHFQMRKMITDKYLNKEEREERMKSLDTLKNFVGNNSLEDFISHIYSGVTEQNKKKKENAVQMMTIHRSKGLEWENVFVVGIEDGEFPSAREGTDMLEEARLMYVATTRSKQNLWVSEIGSGNRFIIEYDDNKTSGNMF